MIGKMSLPSLFEFPDPKNCGLRASTASGGSIHFTASLTRTFIKENVEMSVLGDNRLGRGRSQLHGRP